MDPTTYSYVVLGILSFLAGVVTLPGLRVVRDFVTTIAWARSDG